MSLLHLEDDSASLNAIEAVSAPDEQFHGRIFKVVLVDVLSVDPHDVLVGLHLTKLAHEHVERMLRIEIDLA